MKRALLGLCSLRMAGTVSSTIWRASPKLDVMGLQEIDVVGLQAGERVFEAGVMRAAEKSNSSAP